MPQPVFESRPLAEAAPAPDASGRLRVQLITPGWGSSGYYSPEVLEAAAGPSVFPAGTHMYADHPAASEAYERPERSIRDLAAVLTSDAAWIDGALVAEVQTFAPWQGVLAEMAEVIGVSIRASAEVEMGEAEGRRGRIVTQLVEGTSVDFVTHAGRGGRILDVLESARPSQVVHRVMDRDTNDVTEASARDMREQLTNLLRDAYGAEDTWLWVRDFDPDARVVWYELETADSSAIYEHPYTAAADGQLSLSGDPIEVRVETRYVPVTPAEGTSTTESEEDTMPQIEETRLRQLEADAGRVQTLEAERTAADQRAQDAERRLALSTARDTARPIIAAVLAESTSIPSATAARVTDSVLASLPLTDAGALDETALRSATEAARTVAETEIAAVLEAAGAGRITGLGGSQTDAGDGISESEYAKRLGLTTTTGA